MPFYRNAELTLLPRGTSEDRTLWMGGGGGGTGTGGGGSGGGGLAGERGGFGEIWREIETGGGGLQPTLHCPDWNTSAISSASGVSHFTMIPMLPAVEGQATVSWCFETSQPYRVRPGLRAKDKPKSVGASSPANHIGLYQG